ncbi:MAG: hypothetical protein DVS81_15865 [Candidatus Accumulibacter meliphilus]|jgi:hypothetical protein|uniref:Uncharacterized protein n=1 Tax=Candidatus Accumulibacter meliphilus TaxID=2211374 RepID=A0A369XQ72_9PROT|nr:MAG: hypothetical protein DVS81_15865 [Candidatus Accumulibacter meliphilus]
MNALQQRVRKLERSIRIYKGLDFVIHMIEPGTMRVASRVRLISGGGVVEIDADGKAVEARIAERESA